MTMARFTTNAGFLGSLMGGSDGPTLPAVTPGEVLREEFMVPLELSARQLAAEIDVPPNRITGILHGNRAITADTAIRLGRRFGTTPQFWMNLQTNHDLAVAGDDGRGIPVLEE